MMGAAVARRAVLEGASVFLVSSVKEHQDRRWSHKYAESARDMFSAVKEAYKWCDVFISSAAVCDYRPLRSFRKISKRGIKKKRISMQLERNPDILKWAGENRNSKVLVGFSLSDKTDEKAAVRKMKEKNCQIMIANSTENFGKENRSFLVISEEGYRGYKNIDIDTSAEIILKECSKLLGK